MNHDSPVMRKITGDVLGIGRIIQDPEQDELDRECDNNPFTKSMLIKDCVEAYMMKLYAETGRRTIFNKDEYWKLCRVYSRCCYRAFQHNAFYDGPMKNMQKEVSEAIELEKKKDGFNFDNSPTPWFLKPEKGSGYNYIDGKTY